MECANFALHLFTGTTQNGRVDSWYGETSRGYGDPDYDISGVLRSKTGAAIASVLALRTRLSHEDVAGMRKRAEVRCGPRQSQAARCNPLVSPCLFNVKEDPCELVDLAAVRPLVAVSLSRSLERWRRTAIPASNVAGDRSADPR